MKCESLFSDSPTKLSLCLRTCSSTSIPSASPKTKISDTYSSQKATSKPQYANMFIYDRPNNRYTRQKIIVLSSTTTTASSSKSFNQNQNKFENISKCLKSCNVNLDNQSKRSEKNHFTKWMKCRQSCFSESDLNNHELEYPFLDDSRNQETCDQECDRYWKGTVHWKPCKDHCQNNMNKKKNAELKQKPKYQKESIYDIW